jgi:hypothetical protein
LWGIISVGGASKPSTSRPHSSLVEKLAGPRIIVRPRARSQEEAASNSAAAVSASSSASKKPKKPTASPWNSLWSRLWMAAMRPTPTPSRPARKYSASAWSKNGLDSRQSAARTSRRRGATQAASDRWSR